MTDVKRNTRVPWVATIPRLYTYSTRGVCPKSFMKNSTGAPFMTALIRFPTDRAAACII